LGGWRLCANNLSHSSSLSHIIIIIIIIIIIALQVLFEDLFSF
jgi:hypothetical protein